MLLNFIVQYMYYHLVSGDAPNYNGIIQCPW